MKEMLFTLFPLPFSSKKATVIRNAGGFCTIRFSDGNCGTSGTRVRESKLYRTEEEAKKIVEQHQNANKWR